MKLNNDRGAVLLIASFLIVLSSILLIGYLETAVTDIEIAYNHKNDVLALYIADAGVEAAMDDLLVVQGDGAVARTEFPDTAEDNTYYTTVQTDKQGNIYTIKSTGEYGGFSRVIRVKLRKTGKSVELQYWKEV